VEKKITTKGCLAFKKFGNHYTMFHNNKVSQSFVCTSLSLSSALHSPGSSCLHTWTHFLNQPPVHRLVHLYHLSSPRYVWFMPVFSLPVFILSSACLPCTRLEYLSKCFELELCVRLSLSSFHTTPWHKGGTLWNQHSQESKNVILHSKNSSVKLTLLCPQLKS